MLGSSWHGLPHVPRAAAVRRTVKVLPRPGSLATRRLPLFFSRMARAMASPRPRPRALVEYSGSMIRPRFSGGDADAGVGDVHLDAVVRPARPVTRQLPALRHGFAGVADQVAEHDPHWSASASTGGSDGRAVERHLDRFRARG